MANGDRSRKRGEKDKVKDGGEEERVEEADFEAIATDGAAAAVFFLFLFLFLFLFFFVA